MILCSFEGVGVLKTTSIVKILGNKVVYQSNVSGELFSAIGSKGLLKLIESTMKRDGFSLHSQISCY